MQFFEKTRRRKSYFGFGKQDEEVCWETWILDVTLATPRTDSGECAFREQRQECSSKELHSRSLLPGRTSMFYGVDADAADDTKMSTKSAAQWRTPSVRAPSRS